MLKHVTHTSLILIKIPFWLFELFTSAKSFRANPIIGNDWLNRMGLHVVRLVSAHLIMQLRMWMVSWSISAEDRKVFQRDGYILKENFLPESELLALQQEVSQFSGETREARQGDTITERSVLDPEILTTMPAFANLLQQPSFRQLCSYTAGHIRPPLFYIETVKNQFNSMQSTAEDPQKSFHSDTFHPTMKCWFFINEVKPEEGPFTYIPGSHKLTWKRIKWEYKMSLKVKSLGNNLASGGSFRFSDDDLEELGFAKPVSFAVKPNTLLLGNTFGVHRRGDTQGQTTRTTIWGDSRTNPFIPFPGVTSDWINQLQYTFLADFRRRADEKAKRLGQPSPWKVVEKDL
ncbi:MAG: phytanoyl-CoA dioxygenase family protein [Thiotrichaceae bacterium]